MRSAFRVQGKLALMVLMPIVTAAADVRSEAPAAVAVTVYRAPYAAERFELDALGGYALITETRRVRLPAGESTLRFEGVAGGIEAESAILTGFAQGVIEKNRDARLLSPSALIASSLGRRVQLERAHAKSGGAERIVGTLVSDAEGGVLFKTSAGVEALRCSGLPETFRFEPFAGASATPTLSVRVRSETPVDRIVTLSYLASGFDWSATYTATLSGDGTKMSLGAWVTLANGNGESFSDAETQVVAGRLYRESRDAPPVDAGGPILAQCWPRGSTSDASILPLAMRATPGEDAASPLLMRVLASSAPLMFEKKVELEPLGDLKLYRVPERTTVAARQMKQVRLMDQAAVPVQQVYSGRDDRALESGEPDEPVQLRRKLRTRNSRLNHLGLPLPAGRIAVFATAGGGSLLLAERDLADHALDEDVEIDLGGSPDVRATVTEERRTVDTSGAAVSPLSPGVSLRSVPVRHERRVEISNATGKAADIEWTVEPGAGAQVSGADHALGRKDGQAFFTLRVPPQGRVALHYTVEKNRDLAIPAR